MKKVIMLVFALFASNSLQATTLATDPVALKEFMNAAKKGLVKPLQELIIAGVDVNSCDEQGITALLNALINDQPDAVTALIAAGADVNKSCWDITPLSEAIRRGDVKSVKALLDAGASARVRLSFHEQQNVLHCAITPYKRAFVSPSKQASILKLLIAAHAPLNGTDASGRTALMLAVAHGFPALVEILLEAGADPTLRDYNAKTALYYVTDPESITLSPYQREIINLLIAAKVPLDNCDRFDTTVLMRAAQKGNIELVTALLAAGANPHFKNVLGKTAFDYAATEEIKALFKNLIPLQ